ncbi:hypothetical protein AVEN_50042-1 [Araneus ventricosus]|uniref:Uncharacterized protein n=1 Tax=Araneus ventricosus TaxID=182803 RepID=A0A4Y2XBL2_ARAVE|nr:hypothetical protein AVEN_50042-1 [Araneus ventricosus]
MARGFVSESVVSALWRYIDRTSKEREWSDGVSASDHSSVAERFVKPRTMKTAKLFGMPPTTVHKYEPRVTRDFPNYKPWEQGLIGKS